MKDPKSLADAAIEKASKAQLDLDGMSIEETPKVFEDQFQWMDDSGKFYWAAKAKSPSHVGYPAVPAIQVEVK